MSKFHLHRQHVKKRSKLWILFLMPIIIFGSAAAASVVWYTKNLEPVSDSSEQVVVTIPIGATIPEIADTLIQRGLIRSTLAFDIYTRIQNDRDKMQAGGYKFAPSESTQDIVARLVSGDVATDLFVILPAQRLDQLRSSFVAGGYSVEEVDEALDPSNYANHPALVDKPEGASLEGYIYPESYRKTSDTPLKIIIESALDLLDQAFTPKIVEALKAGGLDRHQAIIMASIVEKEVSSAEDRRTVAQVFLKRYKIGMMLGSDVTAFYGADVAGLERSVFADTPYNTRIYEGLPVGPISNVGFEAINAVAFPSDTDYLFFVSGDDGVTYFSKTIEEHEALAAQHCIELCKSN
jgi:UPF0755 protein